MKKISIFALIICILLIFAGCGAGNKVPSEKEMKNALIEQGANIYNLNYEDQELKYTEFELTKRKSDEAYDEAYVSAVLENDEYVVTVEYVLYHSYYDVGGWILDYFEAYPISIAPNGVNTNKAQVTDELSRFFNRFEIIDNITGTTEGGNPFDAYTFEGYFDYKYASEKFTGEYAEIFIYDTWEPNYYIVNEGIDWSGFIGTWRLDNNGEFIEIEIMDIYQIDDETIEISYAYSTSSWYDETFGGYFRDYWYGEKGKERTENTTKLYFYMTEANMGNMLSECLSEVYTCIYIKPGEYNGSANFEIKLDVNNGVYVEDFMAGFKREGSLGAWDMVGGEDTYFEKIK